MYKQRLAHVGHRSLSNLAAAVAIAAGGLVVVTNEEKQLDLPLKAPEPKPKPKSTMPGFISVQDAMKQTGTDTPKKALAAMNRDRIGRKRMVMMPVHPTSPGRAKERDKEMKRRAKALAKQEASKT